MCDMPLGAEAHDKCCCKIWCSVSQLNKAASFKAKLVSVEKESPCVSSSQGTRSPGNNGKREEDQVSVTPIVSYPSVSNCGPL